MSQILKISRPIKIGAKVIQVDTTDQEHMELSSLIIR